MTAERIARLQASAAALGRLPASPLQAWTRVEAFAKATGPSLAAVLARLGIQGNDDGKLDPAAVQQRSSAAVAASSLEVRDLVLPAGLVGALALPAGLASPSVRELDHGTITSLAT